MFIYVVNARDSVYSVATKYRVNMDSIRITNGLKTDQLVPGQDLLIPSNLYIVQPGDSLYSIAQIALVPIEAIRFFNGLHSDLLTVGMNLYFPPRKKYEQEGLSYITPSTPERNRFIVQAFAPINSYLGAAVDFVFIMAYDWHEASSQPGPVAPIKHFAAFLFLLWLRTSLRSDTFRR
jgi:spore germination protein